MIIDLAAGVLFGILAGMGVGGGGLLVIYLTMFDGVEQRTAQGANLFFFLFASGAAMLYHINKRKINVMFVMICFVFGSAFAVLGSHLAALVHPELLRRIFGAMLILAGGVSLWKTVFAKRTV